jgi:hypothetical protein
MNTPPQALYRFLRMMVVLKLLIQEDDGGFRLLPLGDLLRSDHPHSMRNRILHIGELNYPAAQGMLHAVQTGEPAFDHIFGVPFFEYLAQHPQILALFNDQMGRLVGDRIIGIVAAYDFSKASTIVDVGGGNGTLITAILRAHPQHQGIIFDVPKVMPEAQHYLAQNGVANRCQTISGDFFHDTMPPGGELYLLSNIIHDWDDDRAVQILRNCRAAMRDDSTLLLIEGILPERVADAPGTISSDFGMLLMTGGQERTQTEYRALLALADLKVTAVIPFEPTHIYSGRKPNWAIIESKPLNTQRLSNPFHQ